MKAQEILTAAAAHMSDRASTYDKPAGERSMAQTVEIFNLFHGTALTEAQGWHFMQVLKDVRLFTRPGYHADSAEDGVAYSALKAEAMAAATPKRWSCGEPIKLVAEKSPDESTLDGRSIHPVISPTAGTVICTRAGAWNWMDGRHSLGGIVKYRMNAGSIDGI